MSRSEQIGKMLAESTIAYAKSAGISVDEAVRNVSDELQEHARKSRRQAKIGLPLEVFGEIPERD